MWKAISGVLIVLLVLAVVRLNIQVHSLNNAAIELQRQANEASMAEISWRQNQKALSEMIQIISQTNMENSKRFDALEKKSPR